MKLPDKISIVILVFTCGFLQVNGQTVWDPNVYHSISSEEKTALFFDDFDDNRYKWGLGEAEDDWLEKIADGHLHFRSFDDNAKEDLINFEIEPNKDFEIETSIRFVEGDSLRFFGLQWGKSDDLNNQYDFLISGNNYVTIDKYSGEFFDYLEPSVSDFLRKSHFNKLTIRKLNTNYYFFINEQLVYTMPFKPFFGNFIGFQVSENSSILVDYLKISELRQLNINEPPDIFIKEPLKMNYATSVGNAYKIPEKEITLTGKVTDDGGVYDLSINNKEIPLKLDGEFTVNIPLALDINLIRIIARDRQLVASEKIIYVERTVPDKQEETAEDFSNVNYYALLISVSEYEDPEITDLEQPMKDGLKLKEVLTGKYLFTLKNIKWLQNPTREEMIVAFDNLSKTITRDDNLLIYFAGHGYWDKNLEVGYWLPSDSKKSNPANWFANSTIRDYVGGIRAKHVLLISDACFSGGILKTRSPFSDASPGVTRLYNMPSRKAMTSGTLNEVPDESVFMKYLIKQLEQNKDRFLTSEQLFTTIKPAVMNNSETTPQYGTIQSAGDEGGDFIFILKQ
ncbi:MAG: caspase family protein [Bacteroidales bacterium]|nr:caspase family protein [Bacteroidales bacterium]